MRRRSLELLSRLRRFRSFPGFSAVWMDLERQQSHVAVDVSSRILLISTIAPALNHDSDQEEFPGRAVITSTTTASERRVRVDPSGDVVMTPTDHAHQREVANLRKIVAQLHVNLGHPSNDALARAVRLSGGSDDGIQAA